MDGVVSLPGGFQVGDSFVREAEFRELSGMEEEILLEQKKADGEKGKSLKSFSERLSEILSRCTVRIGDVVSEENKKPKTASTKTFWKYWSSALVGDRSVALVRLRQMSLGDSFVWQDSCPKCNREIPRLEFNLSKASVLPYFRFIEDELAERGIEEASIPALADNLRIEMLQKDSHEVVTPKGTHVVYRLLRRAEEEAISSLVGKRPEQSITALLAAHIISIDGEPLTGISDSNLKYMTTGDRDYLRLYFDRTDGGVDLLVWVECDYPQCGYKFRRPLNPGNPGFFHRLGR